MDVVNLISHVAAVPAAILACGVALRAGGRGVRDAMSGVLAAVAAFGRGEVVQQAQDALRILVGKDKRVARGTEVQWRRVCRSGRSWRRNRNRIVKAPRRAGHHQ
jgi:phosphate/sulfate permease